VEKEEQFKVKIEWFSIFFFKTQFYIIFLF
jgi:hypothetical protein